MADRKSDLLNKEYSMYGCNNDNSPIRQVGNTLLVLLKNYMRLLQDYTRECLKSQRYDSCKSSWRKGRRDNDSDDSDTGASSILSGDTVY